MWFPNYFMLQVLYTFQRNILPVSTSWPRHVEIWDNVGISDLVHSLTVTAKEILKLLVIEARGQQEPEQLIIQGPKYLINRPVGVAGLLVIVGSWSLQYMPGEEVWSENYK